MTSSRTPQQPAGLGLGPRNKADWDQPETRRRGLRDLHRLHRYGLSFRAPRVLPLETCWRYELHDLELLRWYLAHPFFTGMLVLQGEQILLEQYAADFAPAQVHSVQSITKTSVHLFAGALIEAGKLDPGQPVTRYLPEVEAGYGGATVQDALDMAVVNDYTEDFYDPTASVGQLEDAHGWRLSGGAGHVDIRTFLGRIGGAAPRAPDGRLHYKSANTDVVAWVCERVARRNLRDMYLQLIEASGAADTVYLSTDRGGTPFAGGGLHMTLRDLGRYGLLLARAGAGPLGAEVGSRSFRDATRSERAQGSASLLGRGFYRNFLETDGVWLAHNGYGGQWLMVWPEAEIVVACLSGIADEGGLDWTYIGRLAALGEQVAGLLLRN
ncbi:MAG: beta-lactamase family protein [Proteobacteria bacterium]|nr:beta-lactamase family protein [Pseudomonadota bacterium]